MARPHGGSSLVRLVTARRFVVHGRVQGVGFRFWTLRMAEQRGVSGWVRNRLDGTVEVHAEGDPPAIRDAAHALRGAAGEICAPAVVTAAERLEATAEDHDLPRIETKYETLDREIQKLTLDLEAFLKE